MASNAPQPVLSADSIPPAPGSFLSTKLLRDLAAKIPALKEQNARVVVITHEQPAAFEQSDLFLVAVDPQRQVQRALGAVNIAGHPVPAIYVTDRFGEIFSVLHTADAQSLPVADEIIGWLEFINWQCEECIAPEWQG